MDDILFAAADGLRRAHFPPHRNVLAAHVTLFHHLPGEQHEAVVEQLRQTCGATPPLPMKLPSVRFMGRGVGLNVGCDQLLRVRAELARAFKPWLTPQDRAGYQPHITVQNKVDPPTARRLYEDLRQSWTPLAGEAVGLHLWWYRDGPWEAAGTFAFRGLRLPLAFRRPAATMSVERRGVAQLG